VGIRWLKCRGRACTPPGTLFRYFEGCIWCHVWFDWFYLRIWWHESLDFPWVLCSISRNFKLWVSCMAAVNGACCS
jgi:hypothetical protein